MNLFFFRLTLIITKGTAYYKGEQSGFWKYNPYILTKVISNLVHVSTRYTKPGIIGFSYTYEATTTLTEKKKHIKELTLTSFLARLVHGEHVAHSAHHPHTNCTSMCQSLPDRQLGLRFINCMDAGWRRTFMYTQP